MPSKIAQSCVFAKPRGLVFPSGIPNEQDLAGRELGGESPAGQVRSSGGDRLHGALPACPRQGLPSSPAG